MGALGYYLALPLIYAVAWLPMPLLYLLSDGVFVLLFHLLRYRRAVVRTNLRNSFPELDGTARARIERDFYRWFCDLTLETMKTLTITPEQVNRLVRSEGEWNAIFSCSRPKWSAVARCESSICTTSHSPKWFPPP